MQSITIAGRIGRDAETRNAGEGTVTSFTVAVDQRNGRDKTTNWWRVSIWGKRGDSLCQYLRKGDNITVAGEFSLSEYEGKAQLNIRANEVALQGSKGEAPERGERKQSYSEPAGNAGGFDDLDDDSDLPF
jgi:single-strand DNA-binding protein